MVSMLQRYLVIILGVTAAGLVGGAAASLTWSIRGINAPLVSMAEHPFLAALGVFGALLAIGAIGGVAGRFSNAAVGAFVAGAGMVVLAMRTGTIMDVAFAGASTGSIGVETALWGVGCVAVAIMVFAIAGPLEDMQPDSRSRWGGAFTGPAWASLVVGVVAIAAAWLLLRSDMKGQAIGAAVVGGMLCGLAGRLWHPRLQPVLLFAAPSLCIGVAQLIMTGMVSPPAATAFVRNELPRLLWMMPLDVAGGSVLGVSLGIGWARSFIATTTVPAPMTPSISRAQI